jgi:hypothetical protein
MATRKKTDDEQATDKAAERVQQAVDVETDQGYRGAKVDPRPNSDYSLESGAGSPSAAAGYVGELRARADQAAVTADGA